jgi:hypothetical protein
MMQAPIACEARTWQSFRRLIGSQLSAWIWAWSWDPLRFAQRHPPHHLSPAWVNHPAGQDPKAASAAPGQYSNALFEPEGQSILSNLVAVRPRRLPPLGMEKLTVRSWRHFYWIFSVLAIFPHWRRAQRPGLFGVIPASVASDLRYFFSVVREAHPKRVIASASIESRVVVYYREWPAISPFRRSKNYSNYPRTISGAPKAMHLGLP